MSKPIVERKSEWENATETARILNITTRHLLNLRLNGVLKKAKHWRVKNPHAMRLTYQYHVSRIEKLLEEIEEVGG